MYKDKRIIITILALSMILAACNGPAKTDVISGTSNDVDNDSMSSYKEIPIEYVNDIFDFSINDNGGFFIADKDIIHVLNMDEADEDKKISGHMKFCTKIAVNNTNIWIWDSNQKALIYLDKEGNLIEKKQVNLNSIDKMICTDKLLFILGRNEGGAQNIYQYAHGYSDIEKIPVENVVAMCLYTNKCLYIIVQEKGTDTKTIRFNYHTQQIEAETKTTALFFNDIFYSSKDKHIYLTEGCRLIRLSDDGKTQEVLLDLTDRESVLTKICVWNNSILLLDRKNGKILTMDIGLFNKAASPENKIRIISCDSSFGSGNIINDIIKSTREKYIGSSFEFEYVERNLYYDKLKTMLMSKDKSFDIFYLESQQSPYFIKNGIMQDLTEYSFITDKFKYCFDKIRDLCTFDNKIFAIPRSISVRALGFNTELAKKHGIKKPTPGWNWNDFYAMANNIRNNKLSNNIYITACKKDFFPVYFLGTYFCENIDLIKNKANFLNEDFKQILDIYKKLYDENLILDDKTPIKYTDNTLLFLCTFPISDPQITDIVTLPTFSMYNMDLEYLCVNKLSDKKEISTYFISNYLNKDIHAEPFFKDIQAYKGLLSSEENYKLFNHILDNSSPRYYNEDLNIFISTAIRDYLSEKITVDEAIKLIQQKADFILNE